MILVGVAAGTLVILVKVEHPAAVTLVIFLRVEYPAVVRLVHAAVSALSMSIYIHLHK